MYKKLENELYKRGIADVHSITAMAKKLKVF